MRDVPKVELHLHVQGETAGDFVKGFGIAGDENAGRLADFAWSFDMAREARRGLTAHAGEWAAPAPAREALDAPMVARRGHGVRAVEDRGLVERLAGTVLEVCPGSDIALGVCRNWQDHSIERLRAAGVALTVSTDDPPFFRTTMTHEYEMLARTFGWDEERVRETSLVAARAAFCDEDTREGLLGRLTA